MSFIPLPIASNAGQRHRLCFQKSPLQNLATGLVLFRKVVFTVSADVLTVLIGAVNPPVIAPGIHRRTSKTDRNIAVIPLKSMSGKGGENGKYKL